MNTEDLIRMAKLYSTGLSGDLFNLDTLLDDLKSDVAKENPPIEPEPKDFSRIKKLKDAVKNLNK